LGDETRKYRGDDLAARLQDAGVASSVVQTSRDVACDPQLAARGYWRQINHAEMGEITVNVPPFFSVEDGRTTDPEPPPLLGQHTMEIASSMLGLSEAECLRLIKERVFY
jgi:benzylsuccinate CoA-transferase BbsF subunit